MANMTDQNRVNWLLQAFFTASASATFTPGTGGGSALTTHPPYYLLLMATAGTNTANGTQLTQQYGYTTSGASMGSSAFGTPSSGVISNSNTVSWAATGTWQTVNGIEIWDNGGSGSRWLQGAITAITGVVNGDTVQFSAGSISANASGW
jgi:hypothetical protein